MAGHLALARRLRAAGAASRTVAPFRPREPFDLLWRVQRGYHPMLLHEYHDTKPAIAMLSPIVN
jgi:hypothetical protein